MVDTIERSSICLYDLEFTRSNRLNKATKLKLVQALQAHPIAMARLPKNWLANGADADGADATEPDPNLAAGRVAPSKSKKARRR